MPDTTPNYGLRIPRLDGSDYQTPDDLRVPITQIDTNLKRIDDKIGALDANGWIIGTLGSATTQFKVAANFGMNQAVYKRQLDIVFCRFNIWRSGGTLGAGNIANQLMLTVPAALKPTYANGIISPGSSGGGANAYISTTGEIYLTWIAQDMTNGSTSNYYTFNGVWML